MACGVQFGAELTPGSSEAGTGATGGGGGGGEATGASAAAGGGAAPVVEDCNNGVDDDDNGAVDCDDPACAVACSADAFVDDDAQPGGDGSFEQPFAEIADALGVCDGTPKTIFVFEGAYAPFTLPPSCRIVGETRTGVVVDGGGARAVLVPDGGDPAAGLTTLTIRGGDAASEDGGCLFASAGLLELDRVTMTGCVAARGGALAVRGTASLGCAGCELTASSATNGGAVYQESSGSALRFSRSRILGNAAAARGGGVYHADGQLDLENVYVVDNTAGDQSAGIHQAGGPTLFTHVTIAGNAAPNYPGGICCAGGSGAHRNILIWGNPGGGSHGCPLSTSSIQEGPCCGNTSMDPLFVNQAGSDYRLQPISPVIGYGDPGTSLPVDFDGDPRDASPDPGADEVP